MGMDTLCRPERNMFETSVGSTVSLLMLSNAVAGFVLTSCVQMSSSVSKLGLFLPSLL